MGLPLQPNLIPSDSVAAPDSKPGAQLPTRLLKATEPEPALRSHLHRGHSPLHTEVPSPDPPRPHPTSGQSLSARGSATPAASLPQRLLISAAPSPQPAAHRPDRHALLLQPCYGPCGPSVHTQQTAVSRQAQPLPLCSLSSGRGRHLGYPPTPGPGALVPARAGVGPAPTFSLLRAALVSSPLWASGFSSVRWPQRCLQSSYKTKQEARCEAFLLGSGLVNRVSSLPEERADLALGDDGGGRSGPGVWGGGPSSPWEALCGRSGTEGPGQWG